MRPPKDPQIDPYSLPTEVRMYDCQGCGHVEVTRHGEAECDWETTPECILCYELLEECICQFDD